MSIKYVIYSIMVVVQIVMSLTSYIPQIIKLLKRKSSDDISLSSWYVSLIDFGTYQVLLIAGDEGFVLNCLNALQIIQIILVIYLVTKYRSKGKKDNGAESDKKYTI